MRWTLKEVPPSDQVDQLADELQVSHQIATLLVQRNIKNYNEAKSYFRPSLKDLHDPFLMKDMDLAVERIESALYENEQILVYGDYDVDGTTAVSLMATYLRNRKASVATYIPDRYNEGYGVSFEGIDFADDNNFKLIIALDCGVKAVDKIEYAKKKGIDFIVCDHHRPGPELPSAVAILDPKRDDCDYPYDELCGCGIGFKLIEALAARQGHSREQLLPYLDLVATAIAADIVPMTGENRVLAHFGLKQINSDPRMGIKALIKGLNKPSLSITDVVFVIAPRVNAAGRIKHGSYAVELLCSENQKDADTMASAIEDHNQERKELDRKITEEALIQISKNQEEKNHSSVVYDPHWHKGVIGIVASRLIESYYRPTLVFTKNGKKLAASARSVAGFDIYQALTECSEFIEQYGGHTYAAGLTLLPENYNAFKNKFEAVVAASIDQRAKEPVLRIDLELNIKDVTPKFYRILKQFGPFGPKNMKPLFLIRGVQDSGYARKVGDDQKHLKLQVKSGNQSFNAIGFGLGDRLKIIKDNQSFDCVFGIEENHWNGTTSLQLVVKDIKPALN